MAATAGIVATETALYELALFLGTKPNPILLAAGALIAVTAVGVGVYASMENAEEKAKKKEQEICPNTETTAECPADSESDSDETEQPKNPPNIEEFEDPNNLPDGWEWRGKGEPGSREGAYHNPDTGESLHDDRTHAPPKAPHHTYTDPKGQRWDNFGDGYKKQK